MFYYIHFCCILLVILTSGTITVLVQGRTDVDSTVVILLGADIILVLFIDCSVTVIVDCKY